MARISMLIPDDALELIDSVSGNRSAFMIGAAVAEAKRRKRELEDAEIAGIVRARADDDRVVAADFDAAALDGIV